MRFRQRLLQPAPHRRLRDQHRVRRQQCAPRAGLRELGGEQAGEHLEVVAVVQPEIRAHEKLGSESLFSFEGFEGWPLSR
jgi:hypothetical protein